MRTIIKHSILLAITLLGLRLGWTLGQKTSTYAFFFHSEPMLYPCPYDVDENVTACQYRPHEPAPDITVWWHKWRAPEGQHSFPKSSGNWLLDILFFDPPPILDQNNNLLEP